MKRGEGEERQELKLSEAAQSLLDESRMVLPGIQALFGFQLIAVFNERFARDLDKADQCVHLVSIALVVLAMGLVMTPASYHRYRGARIVTDTFIHVSSLLLLGGMVALTFGLSLDFYVIARLVLEGRAVPYFAASLTALLAFLWFVFPRLKSAHHAIVHARQG